MVEQEGSGLVMECPIVANSNTKHVDLAHSPHRLQV